MNSSSVNVTKRNLALDVSWKNFCVLRSSQNRDWQPIYTCASAISLVFETRENCEDWQRQRYDCSPSRGRREPDEGCLRRVRPWVKSRRSPPSRKPLSWGREKKARHKIHWFYSLLICIIKKNCKHFHTYIKMYFMEKVQICYVYITPSSCVSLTKKHWALLDTNVNKR